MQSADRFVWFPPRMLPIRLNTLLVKAICAFLIEMLAQFVTSPVCLCFQTGGLGPGPGLG